MPKTSSISKRPEPSRRQIAIFNTRNDGDRATALLHDQVAMKLAIGGRRRSSLLAVRKVTRSTTRLARHGDQSGTAQLLSGQAEGGTPAILFTGSHGVAFS